jgi:medium-chain acyl-[acyl-carrier-protein] hydrolase
VIRRRIFCFPYAGAGTAVFRAWPDLLPRDVEVCVPILPGRDARTSEPPIAEMAPLIQSIIKQISSHLSLPYAFFGHSMGAFIAFDLACEVRRLGLKEPSHLFVSAQRGPGLPYPETPIFHLPDDQFRAGVVARYDNIPSAILEQGEFMRVLLRILRADFTLVEDYHYHASPPLGCPITVFGGVDDARVSPTQLRAWCAETTARCTLHLLPGGHFFMDSARGELLAMISRELGA